MRTRVVGIGQPVAGDDGVGHAVLDALAAQDLPDDVELVRLREASALLPLLEQAGDVIIVDALVGAGDTGRVVVLETHELSSRALSAVSSHGLGVVQALELARALGSEAPRVRFVGVRITAPSAYRQGLSDAIAKAVPTAVERILSLAEAARA